MDQRVLVPLLGERFGLLQLLLQRGEIGVLQARGLFILIVQLGIFDVGVHTLNLALQPFDIVHAALLRLPAGFHLVELILEVGEFFLKLFQTLLAEVVVLFLEGHFLDLHLHDLAADVVQLCRHGVDLGPD